MLPRDLSAALTTAARRDIVLLASDFDGVLSPLQDDPLACRPVAGSIEALRSVADEPGTTAALVSGRDRQTLSAISGVGELADDPIILIASHGSESSRPDLSCRTISGTSMARTWSRGKTRATAPPSTA